MNLNKFLTVAFYKFVELPDFEARKAPLLAFCEQQGVKGLILLAREGINSTIAGPEEAVRAVLGYLRADSKFSDLQHKESWSELPPFRRMRVRLKKEIVTSGVPEVSPVTMAGTYVKPEDWNALISDPDVVLIDTRNDYEVEIGTFERAIDPAIQTFSQLPGWVDQADVLKPVAGKRPKVAMFCTGGIRCEKSTAMMRAKGYDEVYHLEGGILKYLETIPPRKVFGRVSASYLMSAWRLCMVLNAAKVASVDAAVSHFLRELLSQRSMSLASVAHAVLIGQPRNKSAQRGSGNGSAS